MTRFVLLLCSLLPLAARAFPASVLNHEGRLFDAADRPVDGAVDFAFALYGQSTGGAPVWMEAQRGVAVHQGVYAVRLGESSTIPASVFAANDLYLSVSVGTSGELLPRLRLGTVPFAVVAAKAADAVSLGGLAADEYLTRADAAATYATRSDLATYLEVDDADNAYAKKSDLASVVFTGQLDGFLKSHDAETTYLSKNEAGSSYLSKTDAAATYAPWDRDVRNLLENGGLEAWGGVYQNLGFNASTQTTATATQDRYVPLLPIGFSGVFNGSTATPEGINPSMISSTWLTDGWNNGGRVVSMRTDDPKEGSAYGRLTVIAGGGVDLKVPQLSLEPNRSYVVAMYARSNVSTNTLTIAVGTNTFTINTMTGSWQGFGPFAFTTGATVGSMPLSIRVSGSGSSWVDVDGIGLWRGSTVGELADPRLACPNDMVNGGHFCIEPTPTSKS
ncbi:MAG: hypothetical protein RL199_1010, partial [Pseudomonadota bacterium]